MQLFKTPEKANRPYLVQKATHARVLRALHFKYVIKGYLKVSL